MTELEKTGVTLKSLGFNIQPQPESNKWNEQFSILCGLPKVGKSSFLAEGSETTYFIRMAAEFNHLVTYGEDCRDWSDIMRAVDRLHKANKAGLFKWNTIVFDPCDKLLEYMADHVCEENGNAPSLYEVAGYGVGQRKYKQGIKNFITSILDLPAHKFFVFHTKWVELSEPTNDKKKYHRWELDLSEKLDAEFKRRVHNVLHVVSGYVGSQQTRTMLTQESKFYEAGCKAPCLKKLERIDWGRDDKENYRKFRALFE